MPCKWSENKLNIPGSAGGICFSTGDQPGATLKLWPYRSMPKRGFVWFMGVTAALISVPLFAFLGSFILWAILPFVLGTLGLLWVMIERNYKDADLLEELRLWSDHVSLQRQNPKGEMQTWDSNIYWAEVTLRPKDGPVPNYVTIRGQNREVEIGAFLSEDERIALFSDLETQFARYKSHYDGH